MMGSATYCRAPSCRLFSSVVRQGPAVAHPGRGEKEMRVLVTGVGDVESVLTRSGTPYYILRALREKLGTEHVVLRSLVRPSKSASIAEVFKYAAFLRKYVLRKHVLDV